jgi:hypothetical protein
VNGLGSVVQAKKVAEESVVVRWALRAANLLASDEQEEAAAAKSSERNTETNISGSLPASVESDRLLRTRTDNNECPVEASVVEDSHDQTDPQTARKESTRSGCIGAHQECFRSLLYGRWEDALRPGTVLGNSLDPIKGESRSPENPRTALVMVGKLDSRFPVSDRRKMPKRRENIEKLARTPQR